MWGSFAGSRLTGEVWGWYHSGTMASKGIQSKNDTVVINRITAHRWRRDHWQRAFRAARKLNPELSWAGWMRSGMDLAAKRDLGS